MATQREIGDCFEAFRKAIHEDTTKLRPNYTPTAEDLLILRLIDMGLFILESFVSDVKRIADASEEANTVRDHLEEFDGK